MMMKKPVQPQDKYVLRLPNGMRDNLKKHADNNGRSLNAEIIHRLKESYYPKEIKYPVHDELDEEGLMDAIRFHSNGIETCLNYIYTLKMQKDRN